MFLRAAPVNGQQKGDVLQKEVSLQAPFGRQHVGGARPHWVNLYAGFGSASTAMRDTTVLTDVSGPLEGARRHVQLRPGSTIIAIEKSKSPRNMHYLVLPVSSLPEFLHLAVGDVDPITGAPGGGGVAPHAYESLWGELRGYMDLDGDMPAAGPAQLHDALPDLVAAMQRIADALWTLPALRIVCHTACAHRQQRFSMHITLVATAGDGSAEVFFPDMQHVGRFVAMVCAAAHDNPLVPLVDPVVYTRGRLWRMPYFSKANRNAERLVPLIPQLPDAGRHSSTASSPTWSHMLVSAINCGVGDAAAAAALLEVPGTSLGGGAVRAGYAAPQDLSTLPSDVAPVAAALAAAYGGTQAPRWNAASRTLMVSICSRPPCALFQLETPAAPPRPHTHNNVMMIIQFGPEAHAFNVLQSCHAAHAWTPTAQPHALWVGSRELYRVAVLVPAEDIPEPVMLAACRAATALFTPTPLTPSALFS